jgi:hypothetical protein
MNNDDVNVVVASAVNAVIESELGPTGQSPTPAQGTGQAQGPTGQAPPSGVTGPPPSTSVGPTGQPAQETQAKQKFESIYYVYYIIEIFEDNHKILTQPPEFKIIDLVFEIDSNNFYVFPINSIINPINCDSAILNDINKLYNGKNDATDENFNKFYKKDKYKLKKPEFDDKIKQLKIHGKIYLDPVNYHANIFSFINDNTEEKLNILTDINSIEDALEAILPK